MSNLSELSERLSRLETRLVRGFGEIGVDVTHSNHNPQCIPEEKRIVLRSLDTTVAKIIRIAIDSGLRVGYSEITVEYDGNRILQL
jgi:hypothetical protein